MDNDILNTEIKPVGKALVILRDIFNVFPSAFFFILVCSVMFYFSNIGFAVDADTVIGAFKLLSARLVGSLPFIFSISIGLSLLVATGAAGGIVLSGHTGEACCNNKTSSAP